MGSFDREKIGAMFYLPDIQTDMQVLEINMSDSYCELVEELL
jgi:hypothetical protein